MTPPFSAETDRCRLAQRVWTTRPLRERLRCVRQFRYLLVDEAERLAAMVTQDVGRPADEVFATDIMPTADAGRFLEKQARRLLWPRRIPLRQRPLWLFGSRDTVYRRPRGIVGIIGTWNYPILLNAVQILQALTAGNGVLWKPSELTPMLGNALHDLFLRAGFPADLFIRLPATREAGPQLAEAAIDHIVFTGSADVGRKLARRLGERLISSTLELSGCDALIVTADADIPMAAKAAWWGTTLNKGQTCLAVRRVFVQRAVYPAFLDEMRKHVSSIQQPVMLWPQAEQAQRLVEQAVEQGAQLLTAGLTPRAAAEPPRYPATFVIDALPDMAICQEAAFAPIGAVLPFDHLAEVVNAQNECAYFLGVSIFSERKDKARALAEQLDAGMVCINDVIAPTAHPATPFGGRGQSGWGATQGEEGLLEMTVPQVVSERSGRFRPHYDPASKTSNLLKGMLHWRHGRGCRQRWSGFWRMVRGGTGRTEPNA